MISEKQNKNKQQNNKKQRHKILEMGFIFEIIIFIVGCFFTVKNDNTKKYNPRNKQKQLNQSELKAVLCSCFAGPEV